MNNLFYYITRKLCKNKQPSPKDALFTCHQLKKIDTATIPKHVAIIMDGNRRWAKQHKFNSFEGHSVGIEKVNLILKASIEIKISVLTLFAFSTENWKRSKTEIEYLFNTLKIYLSTNTDRLAKEGIKINAIGDINGLPLSLQEIIQSSVKATKHCSKLTLNLALNYGGRNEIVRACKKICIDKEFINNPDKITESVLSDHLDTAKIMDPELLIRTSGEIRVSNFLLWQIAYTEVYITKHLWPDFSPNHLLEAILDFQRRERREGR